MVFFALISDLGTPFAFLPSGPWPISREHGGGLNADARASEEGRQTTPI